MLDMPNAYNTATPETFGRESLPRSRCSRIPDRTPSREPPRPPSAAAREAVEKVEAPYNVSRPATDERAGQPLYTPWALKEGTP